MIATPKGFEPTDTVAVTEFVDVSMTDTEPLEKLATYAYEPFGVTATPEGFEPTVTVAQTLGELAASTEPPVRAAATMTMADTAAPNSLLQLNVTGNHPLPGS